MTSREDINPDVEATVKDRNAHPGARTIPPGPINIDAGSDTALGTLRTPGGSAP